jgi:hypothetical protein
VKRRAVLLAVLALLAGCSSPPERPRADSEASAAPTSPPSAEQLRAGVAGPWKGCRNDDGGFEISYPMAWQTLPPELGYNHCRFFEPAGLDVRADPEIAALMVREIGDFTDVLANMVTDPSWTIVDRRDVSVDGRPAVRIESEVVGQDTPFDVGTRFYEYLVNRDGQAVSVGTVMGPNRAETYEIYRGVVDLAVATVRFF